jgi:hypothetical protein
MSKLNEIFRIFGPEYVERFGESIPKEHKKVLQTMMDCCTVAKGSLVFLCDACGQVHRFYQGCVNRHCPGCQHHRGRQWLVRQLERQLPGHHFLLTFTVPKELRELLRSHQQLGYKALFAASSGAIRAVAANPRFTGGNLPGFFGVLHTWGRQLQYHPHIHYVVLGGFLAQDGGRHPAPVSFYLPVEALSEVFRARFRDLLHEEGLLKQVDPKVWKID